jgi:hypothetical protein
MKKQLKQQPKHQAQHRLAATKYTQYKLARHSGMLAQKY